MAEADHSEARVFVGSDRSQLLAVKVLEYSIKRRTAMPVSVRSMHDLDLPDPNDIRQAKRTGFSFTRFAIPELAGRQGRALYLDADMLVLRDLAELYWQPFDGAKVQIQEDLPEAAQTKKQGAPSKRIKQCSVMLLDCAALDWDARKIIAGLDGAYTYEELMYELCILQPEDIRYSVPFQWNSLETYEPGRTGLIHYTDMNTQPWVLATNANGFLWLNEVRAMLADGALSLDDVREEVRLGYFRPSLIEEVQAPPTDGPVSAADMARYKAIDERAGFKAHAEVYEHKRQRAAAVAAYNAKMGIAQESGIASFGKRALRAIGRRLGQAG